MCHLLMGEGNTSPSPVCDFSNVFVYQCSRASGLLSLEAIQQAGVGGGRV